MDLSVSQKRVGATHRLGGDKMRSDEVAEGFGSKHGRTDSRGQGAEKTGRGALSRGAGAVKHAASATVGGVRARDPTRSLASRRELFRRRGHA